MAWNDDKNTGDDLTADEWDAHVADQENHSGRHENGGTDEVDVTGLSGDLADAQDPKTHGSTHNAGGTDELSVFDLAGTLAGQGLEVVSGTLQILSSIWDGTHLIADVDASNVNAGAYTVDSDSALLSVAASGQVQLSSGTATVDTGVSAVDATFYLALGVDDPNADVNLAGKLFWDDSAGTYKVTIDEVDTSVGNPTANYDILRVR